jgi:acyl-CoA thioesterase-1
MQRSRFVGPLLAVLVAVTVAASGCDKTEPSQPDEIIAFGDSLVLGVGTTSGNNFVSLLSQRLSVDIRNSGLPGDTTGTALSRLNNSILSRRPRLVIVLLGGNDLAQAVPMAQRVSNITSIAQQIRATGAAVVLVGLTVNATLDPFGGALPGVATQTSSSFVPGVLDGFYGDPAYMADSSHPNNAGHKIMADRIEPVLRAALMQAQGLRHHPAPVDEDRVVHRAAARRVAAGREVARDARRPASR